MKGREIISVAAAAGSITLVAYIALVMWVMGEGPSEAVDRGMAAFIGMVLVPGATAGITAFITTYWEPRP